jgi:hypothetical protein
MAATRTTALVPRGAAAFVVCAFAVRDTSRNKAQIVFLLCFERRLPGCRSELQRRGPRSWIRHRNHKLVLCRNRRDQDWEVNCRANPHAG